MRVKIIDDLGAKGLEKKLNAFLIENEQINVKNIQFTSGFGSIAALIQYDE